MLRNSTVMIVSFFMTKIDTGNLKNGKRNTKFLLNTSLTIKKD